MQSGSYEVTARPASTTGAAPVGRRQIKSQDTQNHGVSRKQESGCVPAPDILTVVTIARTARVIRGRPGSVQAKRWVGATRPLGGAAAVRSVVEVTESLAITPTTVPTIAHRPISTKLITARVRPRRWWFLVRMTPQMPSGIETSPKPGMAVINANSDTLSIGADGHGGGDESTAFACRGTGGGGNAWAGGGFAGSSGWFGISGLMTGPPVTPRVT